MKSKTFTISFADINTSGSSGTPVEIDTVMDYEMLDDKKEINSTQSYYPKQVFFLNDTGIDIEIIILSSPGEVSDYTDRPQYYNYIRVPSGFSFVNDGKFNTCFKMLVKGIGTTADTDLRLDFYSYTYFK